MHKTRSISGILPLAAVLALSACGDDDGVGVDGDGEGQVSAVVVDDPDGQFATASSPSFDLAAAANSFTGQITATADVQLSADGATWIDVGDGSNVALALQSDDEATVAATATVPARTYTRARLVLRNPTATIDAGAILGASSINVALTLDIGGTDDEVVIEKAVNVDVDADARTRLVFDLNSEAWVNEANANDEQVDDSEVENSAEAHAVQESSTDG